MPETQITRCPHCQTTFRIRTEQLSAAKGAVRCGSCLQVFKASEHLVTNKVDANTTTETASTTETKETQVVESKPIESKPIEVKPIEVKSDAEEIIFEDDENIVFSDEIDVFAEDNPNGISSDNSDDISFDEIPDQIQDDPLEDFGIRQPNSDGNESFTSSLKLDESIFGIQETSDYEKNTKNNPLADFEFTVEDTFSDFDSQNEHDEHDESWANSLIEEHETSEVSFSADDESWADDLLDVDEELVNDIDPSFAYATKPEKDDFIPSLEGPQAEDQLHLIGDEHELEQEEVEFIVPGSVDNLHDEPLALNKKAKRRLELNPGYQFPWFWFTASLLMIVILVAQVGYFKFNTWSRHPDYRPIYELICEAAECQLPAIQDVSKMNTQHFMVRPHPDVNQALYIDTLLINNASYNQPFPDLQLIFTGLEDQVIASRNFKPKEYLAGELAGATVMPQKVPIHIAFEIVNPGAEAVSYRIKLVANH